MAKKLFNYKKWIDKTKKNPVKKSGLSEESKKKQKRKVFVFHAFEDPVLNTGYDNRMFQSSVVL